MTSGCEECGFLLWNPVREMSVSLLGLYSDARFPGRCIVSLNPHYEHLEDVDGDIALSFFLDIQEAVKAIKSATGADNVNIAILGNTVAHVHAHLIPRYAEFEEMPELTPWDDPRPRQKMTDESVAEMKVRVLRYFE